jgi:hypothetical protein
MHVYIFSFVAVASPYNFFKLAKHLYQDWNVTCPVYLRVGGIIFASFYDFSIGLWIYSESVAFFSILSDNFFLAVPYSMHVYHLHINQQSW